MGLPWERLDERTGSRAMSGSNGPQPFCSFVRNGRPGGKLFGAFSGVVPRSLGYDSKDSSEINYLVLLSRMSRTVKVWIMMRPAFRDSAIPFEFSASDRTFA